MGTDQERRVESEAGTADAPREGEAPRKAAEGAGIARDDRAAEMGYGVRARAVPRAGISRDERAASAARARLLRICRRHRDELLGDWLENILALPPSRTRFADRPIAELMENTHACLAAFTEMLESGEERLLDEFVSHLVDQRYPQGFSAGSPLLAASQFRSAIAGVIDTMHDDPGDGPVPPAVDVLLAADELLLVFEHRFAEAYTRRAQLVSEERYREIFELATDVLATINRDGRLIQINARFSALLGHETGAWIGRRLAELAVPVDAAILEDAVTAAIGGAPALDVTARCAARDGQTRVMSARISPLSQGDTLLVVLRDVTEETARRAQLLLGEKLASIGHMAASVAHELNNPMAWLMANLEQIRDASVRALRGALPGAGPEAWEETLRAIDTIDSACHEALVGVGRMRDIVSDLNVFSNSAERRPEPMDLVDVLELALRMTGPELSQLCRIERRFGQMPPLVGYPGKLSQVLVNLFINAAQAMPPRPRDENVVRVTASFEDGVYVIEVEDNGRGMEPEVAERIFDAFFTTKEDHARAGIGLWVSRKILEEQRGSMTVSSRPGEGTTFTIRLTGLEPSDVPAPRGPTPAPPPPSRATVLFVDDEPMLLRAFARALGDQHDVLVADSGDRALAILEERAGKVDAIVCDLLMPQMTGMDLFDAIGERFPGLERRMAFMSGGAYTPRAREFVERVHNPKIPKPISIGDLEQAIADLLRASRGD
ncbi:MAG: PAS domain-containing protein [Polyangiaceae bacterium]|nr:PAS domain-containing protein [Polyangiaceae bacterium]